jgi:hypothetical protein
MVPKVAQRLRTPALQENYTPVLLKDYYSAHPLSSLSIILMPAIVAPTMHLNPFIYGKQLKRP